MTVGPYGILRGLGIKEKRPLPISIIGIRATIFA
tara:strand:- start:7796 stop:7897 length:102 start_codon:yes stop_codon:yes gene_type:complete